MSLSKILVIIDPTADTQPAFERALESAKLTGARLHLYLCLTENLGEGNREALVAQQQLELEQMAARAEQDGIETVVEIDAGEDWPQRAIAAAARCSAAMVFKNSFAHSDVQREMRRTSDWALMRLCPCPVLMVHNQADWKHRRVLAAINSQSNDDAHVKLNHQIISFTQEFGDAYGSDTHFVTAYQDLNHPPNKAQLAQQCGTPEEHIHAVEGAAASVITGIASALQVDLIVIGTVGRSGLKGQVVGNTSEKILDHTEADVLVLN
jgi:universal stress protein E